MDWADRVRCAAFPRIGMSEGNVVLELLELRYRAVHFSLDGRPSALTLSSFGGAGRVWVVGLALSDALNGLHAGYGGGARLSFGPSFVVAVDVGHSSQSTAPIYIGLGYLF